eukprot:COSAG06_NODE_67_length_26084_cov_784.027670_16_plen_109_part_00
MNFYNEYLLTFILRPVLPCTCHVPQKRLSGVPVWEGSGEGEAPGKRQTESDHFAKTGSGRNSKVALLLIPGVPFLAFISGVFGALNSETQKKICFLAGYAQFWREHVR